MTVRPVRRTIIAGVSALVLTVGLSACSGETQKEPAAPAKPTVVALDESTPAAVKGEDYRVSGRVLGRVGDRWAGFHGFAQDGTEIYTRDAAVYDSASRPDARDDSLTALMARDPNSGELRVLSDRPGRDQDVDDPPGRLGYHLATIRGQRLVWVEHRFRERDGTLWAYDLDTDEETQLSGDGLGDTPPATYMSAPVIRDDRVYFIGFRVPPKDGGSGQTSLYQVPIDASAPPKEIVRGATDVFEAADDLLEVAFERRIVRWDPARGEDGEIAGTEVRADEAFSNAQGVRVTHDESTGQIEVDSPEHGRFTIEVGDHGSAYLNATDRWVAFTVALDDQYSFVLDMERGELRRMKGQANASPVASTGATYVLTTQGDVAPKTHAVIELLPAS